MRDRNDTAICICCMENIDPVGIHTGDSIVVAPSQTLTNKEFQMLRDSALKIIRELKIEGGCNVQFALCLLYTSLFFVDAALFDHGACGVDHLQVDALRVGRHAEAVVVRVDEDREVDPAAAVVDPEVAVVVAAEHQVDAFAGEFGYEQFARCV